VPIRLTRNLNVFDLRKSNRIRLGVGVAIDVDDLGLAFDDELVIANSLIK